MKKTKQLIKKILITLYNKITTEEFRLTKKLNEAIEIYHQQLKKSRNAANIYDIKTFVDPDRPIFKKKSNKLFILGSGSSINTYTKDNWDEISANDSIGLNHWYIHPFVPTFYMFESTHDKNQFNLILGNLLKSEKKFKNVIKFFKPHHSNTIPDFSEIPNELKDNLIFFQTFITPSKDANELKLYFQLMNDDKFKDKIDFPNIHIQTRASLDQAIMLGIGLGYTEIILCGVDLNNVKYFYEDPMYHDIKEISIPNSGQPGIIHKTIDPKWGTLTMDSVIYTIQEFFKGKVTLYAAKNTSALYPNLKSYFK